LYENHGRTVTRDGMLDAVWGNEYIGEDRLIDTHIKNIRHKLGADAIVTVKGVGYRLKS
ncbi:MAG: winged helix-turn-helix transcriptional regulator, partial [Lachnospiraceae bacterium]|nr:winged helix-turn-helix transcriptional regulator [Lachnospiraceae bacterium]